MELFNIVSNAISKHKITVSIFSDFCVGCLMAGIAFFVMLCINVISFGLGAVLVAISLGFGVMILKLYTYKVPEHMKKEAAITFILHGFYVHIKIMMFISLVLIPLMIILSNVGSYRYAWIYVDGTWIYAREI